MGTVVSIVTIAQLAVGIVALVRREVVTDEVDKLVMTAYNSQNCTSVTFPDNWNTDVFSEDYNCRFLLYETLCMKEAGEKTTSGKVGVKGDCECTSNGDGRACADRLDKLIINNLKIAGGILLGLIVFEILQIICSIAILRENKGEGALQEKQYYVSQTSRLINRFSGSKRNYHQ